MPEKVSDIPDKQIAAPRSVSYMGLVALDEIEIYQQAAAALPGHEVTVYTLETEADAVEAARIHDGIYAGNPEVGTRGVFSSEAMGNYWFQERGQKLPVRVSNTGGGTSLSDFWRELNLIKQANVED